MSDQGDTPIISIRNVSKYFGTFTALKDINIDIRPGEIFALLGPSGCGKSTLLRIIAGFESASEGDVLIDGQDMTNVPPNKRPVNMVFQSYAVFPHMSVEQNVAYGLKMDGQSASEIAPKVAEALDQVHLTPFAKRMPDQLSGGQRQRVALARALVKRPRVLLLDEPLSALDAKLRDAMRLELVKLQESVGVSFVMVTHDQSEALAMADRVAVLSEGHLRQLAPPIELYQEPADAFVADFIGRVNMFDLADASAGDTVVEVEALGQLTLPMPVPENISGNAKLCARPEHFTVTGPGQTPPAGLNLSGVLGDVAFEGDSAMVEVSLETGQHILALSENENMADLLNRDPGEPVTVTLDVSQVRVVPNSAINAE